jgi:hypothetical protein
MECYPDSLIGRLAYPVSRLWSRRHERKSTR